MATAVFILSPHSLQLGNSIIKGRKQLRIPQGITRLLYKSPYSAFYSHNKNVRYHLFKLESQLEMPMDYSSLGGYQKRLQILDMFLYLLKNLRWNSSMSLLNGGVHLWWGYCV